MEKNIIYNEPCLTTIERFPDNSIDCVITSPPYWQLRDYGYTGQWGLEPTFQEYLEHLWQLMDAIYPKLKKTGTVWINLGDTYGTKSGNMTSGNIVDNKIKYTGGIKDYAKPLGLDKCLLLIPHRFAIGCIDRGWIIRNDIVWAKRNGMPESVTDRFSKKHEYFFFMTKSTDYYFDLDGVKDKMAKSSIGRLSQNIGLQNGSERSINGGYKSNGNMKACGSIDSGKNPGSISDFWDIPTKPSSKEHYAQYNDELLKKPIIAGCPQYVCSKCGKPRGKIIENTPMVIKRSNRRDLMGQPNGTASSGTMLSPAVNIVTGLTDCGCNAGFVGGLIYDPFMGSGTTALMALRTDRYFIGSEMSEKYCQIANKHIQPILNQMTIF